VVGEAEGQFVLRAAGKRSDPFDNGFDSHRVIPADHPDCDFLTFFVFLPVGSEQRHSAARKIGQSGKFGGSVLAFHPVCLDPYGEVDLNTVVEPARAWSQQGRLFLRLPRHGNKDVSIFLAEYRDLVSDDVLVLKLDEEEVAHGRKRLFRIFRAQPGSTSTVALNQTGARLEVMMQVAGNDQISGVITERRLDRGQ